MAHASLLSTPIWLILLAHGLFAAQPATNRWRNGTETRRTLAPGELQPTLQTLANSGREHAFVQLRAIPDADQAEDLERAGVRLLQYAGELGYLATLDAQRISASAADRFGLLIDAQPMQLEWKLHPELTAPGGAAWMSRPSPEGDVTVVYAAFFPDVDPADARAAVAAVGGHVVDEVRSLNALVIEIPATAVIGLADFDAVQWIEPALPPLRPLNDGARTNCQADVVQSAPYALTGAGVVAMVYDSGRVRSTHFDFGGRVTTHDTSPVQFHSTHVAGTLGGSGASSGGQYRGVAPGVLIESFGFQTMASGAMLFFNNPGDIERDYEDAIELYGVDVANNSVGTLVEQNGYPCSIQGDYSLTSALMDGIIRGSLGRPIAFALAGGNERTFATCGNQYNTIPPSAASKNPIVVGAIHSDTSAMTSFSSWGPVDDGRIKPDVVAPGDEARNDSIITSTSDACDNCYGGFQGTSMATPVVTGLTALLLQDFRQQFANLPDPLNSTYKMLLAHSAADLGNPGPDYQFGYGAVRAQAAVDQLRSGRFLEGAVQNTGAFRATVLVLPGETQLKVTLAWDDVPAAPNAAISLVNDLDLRVFSPAPGFVQHFPWTLDPQSPATPAIRTVADHRNNLEQVVVDSPTPGVWFIEVVGTSVPAGPQTFSLGSSAELRAIHTVYPNGRPEIVSPNVATSFEVILRPVGQSIVPGTPTLNFRYDGQQYFQRPLLPIGDARYLVTLPAPTCEAVPEYYLSMVGTQSAGLAFDPPSGPANDYTTTVLHSSVIVEDAFEADTGWTAGSPSDTATTGQWVRVVPVGTSAAPVADHTPGAGAACWITGQHVSGSANLSDVDGGTTTLTSPVFNLAGTDPVISYWRWFLASATGVIDMEYFLVEVTQDGVNWVEVERIGPGEVGSTGSWDSHSFRLADYITPSSNVRIRFIAADFGADVPVVTLVEGGLDDFAITNYGCDAPADDCNHNHIVDGYEIAVGITPDDDHDGVPDDCFCSGDLDGDFVVGLSDLGQLLQSYGVNGGGDLDGDNDTDLADLGALLQAYGTDCR